MCRVCVSKVERRLASLSQKDELWARTLNMGWFAPIFCHDVTSHDSYVKLVVIPHLWWVFIDSKNCVVRSYLRTEVGLVKKSSAMSRKNPKDLTQKASHSSRISNNPKICPQKVKLQPKTFKTHLSKRVGKQIATSTKPILIFVVTGQGSTTRTFSN